MKSLKPLSNHDTKVLRVLRMLSVSPLKAADMAEKGRTPNSEFREHHLAVYCTIHST
jgi:hypothetical protein